MPVQSSSSNTALNLAADAAFANLAGTDDNDVLTGTSDNDNLSALGGEDDITGGAGNDTIDGGDGADQVYFSGNLGDYQFVVTNGVIQVIDANSANGNDGTDTLSNVEFLNFADRILRVEDGLRYIASYADLIAALGTNADAGLSHYLNHAHIENRQVTFDPEVYLSKYADLRAQFGGDLAAATAHYITTGFAGGRSASLTSADNLSGTAGDDAIRGFGGNDTINAGAGNDALFGDTGNDVLNGGDGDDVLNGGTGVDSYNGGAGRDELVFDGGMSGVAINLLTGTIANDGYGNAETVSGVEVVTTWDRADLITLDNNGRLAFAGGGDDNVIGGSGNDTIYADFGDDAVVAGAGDDLLVGGDGNDSLLGGIGNDILDGGVGNDVLDGQTGNDVISYEGDISEYTLTASYEGQDLRISILDNEAGNGDEGLDSVRNVETLRFAGRDLDISNLTVLRYVASYSDVIASAGTDLSKGLNSYFNYIPQGQRSISFDPTIYLNKYASVKALVGNNLEAATRYYIETGFGLGHNASLNSADSLTGTAGNDVIRGYGGNDTIDGAAGDDVAVYVDYLADYRFTVNGGVISVTDKYLPNGDEGTDSVRNVETLRFGDRDMNVTTLNALRYVASNGDLIGPIGTNTDAALAHYLNFSVKEGRSVNFDPTVYLNKYADARAAAGNDLEAATRHFITTGVFLGRNSSTTSADNLVGTSGNDTIRGYGGNDSIDGGAGTDIAVYVDYLADYRFSVSGGVITITDKYLPSGDEGTDTVRNVETLRFGDRDMNVTTLNALRYVASYGDLISVIGTNTDTALAHYLNNSVKAGRIVNFDPSVYLNKYADVRAAAGSDLEAATRHYISTGFVAGRNDSISSNDNLSGTAGNDNINAYGGNDTIRGALGNDVIDGGSGTDIAVYADYVADYSYSVSAGVITITDKYLPDGNEGADTVSNVEVLRFGDRDMNVTTLNTLRYIASHGDLINAIGNNTDAGLTHYLRYSVKEGRAVTFDPNVYLAKYADVRAAFGTDQEAATRHFLTTGFAQGRNLNLNGNDVLTGSSSADTLEGGAGNDTITGAGGADIFKFAAGSGVDRIADFSSAQGDKISLVKNLNASNIVDFASLQTHISGTVDAVLDLGGGHTITLTGVAANSLSAADFIFV